MERQACYRVGHHLGEHEEGSSKITTPRIIHSKRKFLGNSTDAFISRSSESIITDEQCT